MGKEKKIIVKNKSSSCDCGSSDSGGCSKCTTSTSSDSSCYETSDCKSQPKILIVEANSSSSSSCSSSISCKPYKKKKGCGGCGNCNNCCVKNNNYSYGRMSACNMGCAYYTICAIVAPVKNLTLFNGTCEGSIKIHVSIICNTVTLQWEGFSGQVDSSGIAYIYINQIFNAMPEFNIVGTFLVNFKGTDAVSAVEILARCSTTNTIRWYLSSSRKSSNVANGDNFSVYPGSITYIFRNHCN